MVVMRGNARWTATAQMRLAVTAGAGVIASVTKQSRKALRQD